MSSPHDRDSMFFKDSTYDSNFPAKLPLSSIMAAADTQMHYVRRPVQQILNFFIQTCILTWKMTTSAAFHKGQYFNIFPLIESKCLCPAVQGSKAATPCAYILSLGTG